MGRGSRHTDTGRLRIAQGVTLAWLNTAYRTKQAMRGVWRDYDKLEFLIKHWRAGHTSGWIAQKIGVSRSSVCSKIRVLGLQRFKQKTG